LPPHPSLKLRSASKEKLNLPYTAKFIIMSKENINRKHWGMEQGVTGEEDETGLLGFIDKTKYIQLLEKGGIDLKDKDNPELLSYVPFEKSSFLVRESQPWKDAANPKTDFLRELRLAVAEALEIPEDDAALDKLKIYTAVGSHLDLFHGVDAFIEWEQEKEEPALRVDFDVTQKPETKTPQENTVIINTNQLADPKEDEKKYLDQIKSIARHIAELLKKQKEK